MKPTWFIYLTSAFLPLLTLYLLRRVRREYDSEGKLSSTTVSFVWLLYLVQVALTIWSALLSLWRIPMSRLLAMTLGPFLLLAGTTICAAGITAFASFSRMSGMKTDRLISGGIYCWSRNPQNVGLRIALIGVAILGRSGFALLLAALFWVLLRIYLPIEEAYLRRIFGEPYEDYYCRTARFIGRLG